MLVSDLDKLKKEIELFFEKATFKVQVQVKLEDEVLKVNIQSDEPQVLIGERGRVLLCIQRLLATILSRKFGPGLYLDLDINQYKEKKIRYLKELARETADRVVLTKKERALPAMAAFERRVIHLELAQRQDVVSESMGQEPERRVVIKPYP